MQCLYFSPLTIMQTKTYWVKSWSFKQSWVVWFSVPCRSVPFRSVADNDLERQSTFMDWQGSQKYDAFCPMSLGRILHALASCLSLKIMQTKTGWLKTWSFMFQQSWVVLLSVPVRSVPFSLVPFRSVLDNDLQTQRTSLDWQGSQNTRLFVLCL